MKAIVVIAAIGVTANLDATVLDRGARLLAALTNQSGETTTLMLRIGVRCRPNALGLRTCSRGRFRKCAGPACAARAGVMTFRPESKDGPVFSMPGTKRRQCFLTLAPGQSETPAIGTYQCNYVSFSPGETGSIYPFDRGSFVVTDVAP